jgi:RHH-type proline utilization regulon transcriptional repressor/proline dehydrogenase/delta 1-pyrroline-5-carboxylate dehydrogenase
VLRAALAGWNGIGFVIQAYQKRCPFVIDYVVDLARRSRHRLMVRLVKGAYWDSEIKRAQVEGLDGYPVYTRKAYTDVSYLACARQAARRARSIYPQFATHNAHTLAADLHDGRPVALHAGAVRIPVPARHGRAAVRAGGRAARAAVPHLRARGHARDAAGVPGAAAAGERRQHLVRQPHRRPDRFSLEALVEDPVATVERMARRKARFGLPHPAIPLPAALYGAQRANSRGLDLANDDSLRLRWATRCWPQPPANDWRASPLLAEAARPARSMAGPTC